MKTPLISTSKIVIKPAAKERKAFALVLALSLMGFMMLLVITLAAMVQMQMRLSQHSLVEQKAKQAAKFAAYQALSRVQVALGPDRRISANAKMFDGELADGINKLEVSASDRYDWWDKPMDISRTDVNTIDSAIGQNRYWVGVWDSRLGYSPDKIKREQQRNEYVQKTIDGAIAWLVSGNMINNPDELVKSGDSSSVVHKPYSFLEKGQYVRAVSKGSSANDNGEIDRNTDVLVPLVTLEKDPDPVSGEMDNDKRQTRIAWWVSDEGQKASLNAVASYEDIENAKKIDPYRLQSLPFYSGIHGLTLMNSDGASGSKALSFEMDDSEDDTSSMAKIRRLDDIRDLDVYKAGDIPTNVSATKAFFHSATFNSKGLLVNVQQGGMKKDLTIGLTRRDLQNEKTTLTESPQSSSGTKNMYFELPMGVAGYEYKQTAYPLWNANDASMLTYRRIPSSTALERRSLNGSGHMFGPQLYGNEDLDNYTRATVMDNTAKGYDDINLWKDPGGPLWDQLRSYYNLRAPNDPDSNKNDARIQVDDRISFKPVVKRFQVFYVPTFVRYNSFKYANIETYPKNRAYNGYATEPYGLRLHIIPLLVLWNPYDVKIPGGTYYLISLTSRTPMGAARDHNPLSMYRFAIGYETNNGYFQCLRDLRTEFMPSLDVEFLRNPTRTIPGSFTEKSPNPNQDIGLMNNEEDNVFKALFVPFRIFGDWEKAYHKLNGWNIMQYSAGKDAKRMMSTKTFYNQVGAYPLGYGSLAPVATVSPQGGGTNDMTRYAWKAFVSNPNNLYPDIAEVYRRKKIQLAASNSPNLYSARVAKVPLYLNNIPAAAFRGWFKNQESGSRLFKVQRAINVKNPNNYANASNATNESQMLMDVGLRFLVKDEKGIEAGKAKVFAMRSMVNYMGDGEGTPSMLYNGPNGNVEGSGTGESPYEKQGAMMLGIGENGAALGNGFYIDVPHPENEHYYKFRGRSWDSDDGSSNRNPHVLFDLGLITHYRNDLEDPHGGKPPTSIDNYLIDMDDYSGTSWGFSGTNLPLQARANSTPFGYGLFHRRAGTAINTTLGAPAWNNSIPVVVADTCDTASQGDGHSIFYGNNYKNPSYYKYLEVNMWMWNREGMRLAETSPTANWDYVQNTPLFYYAKGQRVFLGMFSKSFPDPQLQYSTKSGVDAVVQTTASRNFFVMGYTRSTGNQYVTLNPYEFGSSNENNGYYKYDKTIMTKVGASETINQDVEGGFYEKVANVDDSDNPSELGIEGRQRYFLNWLGINAARHSANSWKMYNGTFDRQIGDLAPKAHKSAYVVKSLTKYNYGDELHSAILQSEEKGCVPYGFVFGLPYADNELGSEPLFNRKVFVGGSTQATAYDFDLSAKGLNHGLPMPQNDQYKTLVAESGRMNKNIQAISQVFGDKDDGISENNAGYNISNQMRENNKYMVIGLKQSRGTTQAPIHHILREKEIVSNPANLSTAHMTFLIGRSRYHLISQQFNGSDKLYQSYGNDATDCLDAEFAIGNSLCPYRMVPERSFHVSWLDGVSQNESGYTASGEFYAISNPYGSVDYQREIKSSRGPGSADWVEDRNVLYDMSWNLNNILWDDYFFSTLPYRKDERSSVTGKYVYPQNPRIKYYLGKGELPEDVYFKSDAFGEDLIKEYVENSSKLWVDGAFNVNSTDIDAWKAVLSTYYGTTVVPYQGTANSGGKGETPFLRFGAPFAGKPFRKTSSVDSEDTVMQGYRSLDADEIEQLAAAIVEHVKDRGPFYSMSHFVNRVVANNSAEERFTDKYSSENRLSLVPKQDKFDERKNLEDELKNDNLTYKLTHMQKGVLQSAIDATSINEPFHKDPDLIIETGTNSRNMGEAFKSDSRYSVMRDPKNVWENWRGAIGPQAAGAPTYLMQQDILARLGSFLTVRSDTFKIRAYGEIRNPISGIIEAKAWCEMMVQRVPDYIDQTVENQNRHEIYEREFEVGNNSKNPNPYSSSIPMDGFVQGELSDLNKELGRRFKVVSFRWLNENEI